MTTDDPPPSKDDGAPDHVESMVQEMADLHAERAQNITGPERLVVRLTAALGRPRTLAAALAAAAGWVAFNLAAPRLGIAAPDPPPFAWLDLLAQLLALFATILILTTQRREEEVARRRAQLTLQLSALSEQKIAKVIDMIQEQRRENPMLPTRHDPEAADMARAANPREVLDRIIETHEPDPGRG